MKVGVTVVLALTVLILVGIQAPRSTGAALATTPTATPVAPYSTTLPIVKGYLPPTPTGGGPGVLNLSSLVANPTQDALAEWTFDLSTTYPNPYYFYDPTDTAASDPTNETWYGVNGVSVDMHLTSPSGKSIDVPAFWDENYLRLQASGREILGHTDNGHWHVRFTPVEAGTYTYTITAQDATGTSTYPGTGNLSFNVSGASANGFVRASPTDPRFGVFDNGTSFIPISVPWGQQWWSNAQLKSYAYDTDFATDAASKVNLARVWESSDFALSTEGAQPVWQAQSGSTNVEINTSNVHSGMRAANVTANNGWFQPVALASPGSTYQLSIWLATTNLSGGSAQATISTGTAFNNGTLLGATPAISGTTGYTQYTVTFTPGASNNIVTLDLLSTATTGNAYFDDISFGPSDGNGGILYNVLSDPGMERQFANGMPNDDPNANPNLPRPLGTYYNQWASFELDDIVASAQADGMELQLCSCSGPWFTWPVNPSDIATYDTTYTQPWFLHLWERNFRYRVARWGYSPAVLAWELQNETGGVPADSTEYSFFQSYGAYQLATDPYQHMRTTSQSSQSFSAGMWSSPAFDLSNYHDYMMSDRYPAAMFQDEANFVFQLGWCLRNVATSCPPGLADAGGSSWTGPQKPLVWGEIGILQPGWGQPIPAGTSGEGGHRAIHNEMWAGLFNPIGTSPIEWNQPTDQTTITESFAERLIAANFFANVDYAHANFSYQMTAADKPAGYSGSTVGATDPAARVYAMIRQDQNAAYLWVQNRNNTWYNAPTVPNPINPTVTIGGLLSRSYTVEIWNPYTGSIISSTQQTPVSGQVSIPISNLTSDVAIKVY
jgi:hypothetical protein